MRKRIALLLLPVLVGACSDVAAPAKKAPAAPSRDVIAPNPDGTCRSGYSVATGRNGEIICVSDSGSEQSLKQRHVKGA